MPRAPKPPSPPSELPAGFHYFPDFIDREEESRLLAEIGRLEFAPFEFRGFLAKRRKVEYGWRYDFTARKAGKAPPVPEFLFPLRAHAAGAAGVRPEDLEEAVVLEYPPGAPIGWHRDVPDFETVVGISLLSACRLRLKPYRGEGRLLSVILEPRSCYVLSGEARWKFQHSIPGVEQLRYSIVFRTLARKL
jgi:alkylated DNA repair dioxygenase AlkB